MGGPTLNRLYSLHYLFPFVIAGVVVLHIWALHIPGNNNPIGIDVKTARDTVPFHPYYTIKDGFALVAFIFLFAAVVFYAPNYLGHPDNYVPANPLQTPPHIVPEWYFLPFYAILRAIPNKLLGVIALLSSISVLFFVPWLDTSKVRSTSYRPIYKWFFWVFAMTCVALGYLGSQQPEGWYLVFGRILTVYYFAFFLLVMPVVGLIEKPRRLPGSITEPVLGPEEAKKLYRHAARAPLSASRGGGVMKPLRLLVAARPLLSWLPGASLAEESDAAATAITRPRSRIRAGASRRRSAPSTSRQLQRGFQVYKEVCSNCHSMRLLSYRNLGEPGGPEFSPKAVEVLASQVQVTDGPNDKGEMFQRPARPSDHFRSPFANDQLARLANNGALPPDLSVMAKAREGGPDYIYALLTGFKPAPPDFQVASLSAISSSAVCASGMRRSASARHIIAMPSSDPRS